LKADTVAAFGREYVITTAMDQAGFFALIHAQISVHQSCSDVNASNATS
jgi:hypothetical protein